MMADQYLDILALNETRLDSSICDNQVHIDGYSIIRRDRNRVGGGVSIYIRTTINYNLRVDLTSDAYEILSIDILKPNSSPFNVTALYRPPNCDDGFFSNLESIILGDLNCNYLTNSDNSQLTQLKLIGEVYQLTQLIKEPTRVTQISSTLIDKIFTSDPSKFILSGVSHIGISDHSLVCAMCYVI